MKIHQIFENVGSGNPNCLFLGWWCTDIRNQF
jgi:hypothetical protein